MLIICILFFVLGAAIGSFLNVIIIRLKTRESILKVRSHCPFCKKKLIWHELIPIVSFLLQKGRCRHCKKRISLQYPLVELAAGLLFVLVWNFSAIGETSPLWGGQFLISVIFWLFVISCLIIIFVYDLKHSIIPNKVIYPAILVSGIWYLVSGIFIQNTKYEILNTFLAAIIAGAFFLSIVLISRGKWMGMGDAKMAVFMGLVLGWPNILLAFLIAFFSGAVISGILIALKKKTLKSQIPFGPFLSAATMLTILYGDRLIDWYFGILF